MMIFAACVASGEYRVGLLADANFRMDFLGPISFKKVQISGKLL
jgi:hypothetical protein